MLYLLDTVKTTCISNYTRTLSHIIITYRNFKHHQTFQFHSLINWRKQKHAHSLLPIKPISSFAKVCVVSMHSFAWICNARHAFDEMSDRREFFEIRHYYDVLDLIRLSTTKLDMVAALAVHSLALKAGVLAHLPSSTSLLIKYSRAGYVGHSMTLFDEIMYKDVVVWNAMLTAAVENHCSVDSMKLFVQMVKGYEFDSATLVIVVSVISRSNKLSQGQEVHGLSVKAGMVLDTFYSNALINMYAKCGDLRSSESLFASLESRDAVSWNSLICGCLYNDELVKSLLYFKEMSRTGVLADNVSLSSAVAVCTHMGEWDAGQVLHGLGVKLGFDGSTHISVSNSLIPFYSGCGEINIARTVFRRLICKDVVTWNAMIDGFASNGLIIEAFDCLYEMQLTGHVHPDTVTILTILPLCAELNLSREGKTIHAFTLKRALGLELSVINSLIDMYMKCNRVKEAEQLFQDMAETDLVTWNTMISGYSQNGHSREAQSLFKKLLHWCSGCSLSTMLGVIPSCNSLASLNFGRLLHGWQIKLGFLNNMLVVSSLMFMYIKCGDLKTCFSLVWRFYAIMDTASWNAVIVGCTQNGYYLDSLRTFNLMRRESQAFHDSITLVSVISACGNLELLLEGQWSHGLAVKTSVDTDIRLQNALITMYGKLGEIYSANLVFNFCYFRNLCSWNCMISALSQNNNAKEALALFRYLDFEPDEITIATILSVCTQLGLAGFGKQIHGYVFRFQIHTNSFIIAALVDSYSNSGRLERAATVFQHSSEKSVAAWNSMMSAYGFHSKGQDAIKLFQLMIISGTRPNKSTLISLLSACSHVGLVDEGIWYYDSMAIEHGVQPVIEHHVCLVDLLGKSGRLRDAYEFIKQIRCEREPGMWGALLSACNYHGDVELGREVADILFELDPENAGYYISLSNMYVAAGRWSDAVEFRSLIHDKRLKKPAGYSLIDVGLG